MSREVLFVVAVDVDKKTVYIDAETEAVRFTPDEGYFDTEKGEWFEDTDDVLYQQALEILETKKLEDH